MVRERVEAITAPENRVRMNALIMLIACLIAPALGIGGLWDGMRLFPDRVSPFWGLAFSIPGCVLLLFKEKHPIAVLCATGALWIADLITVGGFGSLLVVIDALWTASLRGSERVRRGILIAIVVTVIAITTFVAIRTPTVEVIVLLALSSSAVLGTTYWAATAIARANDLADRHKRDRDSVAERASRERSDALRAERETMARELHDLVAGHISAVALRSEAALLGGEENAAHAGERAALRAIRESSLQAHSALRSMITVLRAGDTDLRSPEGWEALPTIVTDAERAGLTLTVTIDDVPALPSHVEQLAVRIVREGLANAARHSAGRCADLQLRAEQGRIVILISSDGATSAASDLGGNGWGLDLLRQRTDALGGTLTAGPFGASWVLKAALPLTARPES